MAKVERNFFRMGLGVVTMGLVLGCDTPPEVIVSPTATPKPTAEPAERKQPPEGGIILKFGMFYRHANLSLINQSEFELLVHYSAVKYWADHCPAPKLLIGVNVVFRNKLPGGKPFNVNKSPNNTGISFGLDSISPSTKDAINQTVHRQLISELCKDRDPEALPDHPRVVSISRK